MTTSCRAPPCGTWLLRRSDVWRGERVPAQHVRGVPLFRDVHSHGAWLLRCDDAQHAYGVLPIACGVRLLSLTWGFPVWVVRWARLAFPEKLGNAHICEMFLMTNALTEAGSGARLVIYPS